MPAAVRLGGDFRGGGYDRDLLLPLVPDPGNPAHVPLVFRDFVARYGFGLGLQQSQTTEPASELTRAAAAYGLTGPGAFTSFGADTPRYVTDETGADLGLLVEPASATNVIADSADYGTANWGNQACGRAADAGAPNPIGGAATWAVFPNTTNTSHFLNQSFGARSTASGQHTFSFVVRPKGGQKRMRLHLISSDWATDTRADYDVVAGAVLSTSPGADSADVEPLGGGWHRLILRATPIATAGARTIRLQFLSDAGASVYAGPGADGANFAHAQMEVGGVATSPIVTTTGSVTRPADVFDVAPPVTWGGEGALLVNVPPGSRALDMPLRLQIGGTSSDSVAISRNSTDDGWRFDYRAGGVLIAGQNLADATTGYVPGTAARLATSWSGTTVNSSVNGYATPGVASSAVPSGFDRLRCGVVGPVVLDRVAAWRTLFSTAELAGLTS